MPLKIYVLYIIISTHFVNYFKCLWGSFLQTDLSFQVHSLLGVHHVILLRNEFFLYKSFFVNYIVSFCLVGLWTIRLLVQVHRHWVQFTLARREYDNHNRHNKPKIGREAGVWMTSWPEAMGWEFGDFEKDVSWVSTVGYSSWVSAVDQSSW